MIRYRDRLLARIEGLSLRSETQVRQAEVVITVLGLLVTAFYAVANEISSNAAFALRTVLWLCLIAGGTTVTRALYELHRFYRPQERAYLSDVRKEQAEYEIIRSEVEKQVGHSVADSSDVEDWVEQIFAESQMPMLCDIIETNEAIIRERAQILIRARKQMFFATIPLFLLASMILLDGEREWLNARADKQKFYTDGATEAGTGGSQAGTTEEILSGRARCSPVGTASAAEAAVPDGRRDVAEETPVSATPISK